MRTLALASAALALYATVNLHTALAQQAVPFAGTCKGMTEQACKESGWCRWSVRKPVALPNGQTVTPAAYCGFKSGLKAAYAVQQK
jgi:hypothetical protein